MGTSAGAIARKNPDAPIYREALGRVAWLGDLYDATTDNFCKKSIFRQPLPPDSPAVSRTDNRHSETRYLKASSLEEKFRELKITAELRLSVLAGMCELEGSAKYLKQENNSFGTVISTQLCHFKTATERLEVSHDEVRNYISEKAMRHHRATHVVIEIEWGADCVITAREQKHVIENRRKTRGGFGVVAAIFGRIGLIVDTGRGETKETTDTSVEISGDVLPNRLPTSLVDAQAMMENIPELLEDYNGGKGKPLAYVMIPIWDRDLQVSGRPRQSIRTFISVDDASIMKIVRLFDYATKVQDQLEIRSEVEDSFEVHEAKAKDKLYKRVEKVRSGRKDVKCLDRFYNRYYRLLQSILDRRGILCDESWQQSSSGICVSTDEVECTL